MENKFNQLYELDVNKKTEKKNGLTYLSWAWAWAEFTKVYPGATYDVIHYNGKPYVCDENLGYMVFTEVTADGITRKMWLTVMDGANKAMKTEPYTYKTKYGEKNVEAATMFDINKAIMRCLTKNLAMFGLGLYIYAGEDLPEENTPKLTPIKKQDKKLETKLSNLFELADEKKKSALEMMALMNDKFGVTASTDLTEKQIDELISIISKE